MKKKILLMSLCAIALVACFCCGAVAYADVTGTPRSSASYIYVIGDESIGGMYGAMAVGGNGEQNGYYTSVQEGGAYVYTYSKHSSGWSAAMQNAVTELVEVRLASDWTAQSATGGATSFGSGDVFVDGAIAVPAYARVVLDLNGKVLDRAITGSGKANGSVIRVLPNGSLEITDSVPNSEHKNGGTDKYTYSDKISTTDGEGKVTIKEMTYPVQGGIITGGKTSGIGGGVLAESGSLTLSGGTIFGNVAENGAGVGVVGGTFTINGGKICGNNATATAGGAYISDAELEMNGGTICDNTATTAGGGILVNGGTAVINNGKVSANTAQNGGGVHSIGSFAMKSGMVCGNVAQEAGGAIYVGAGTFSMSGGSMLGNTAQNGGGIAVCGGAAVIGQSSRIGGNTAQDGGAMQVSDGRLTLNNSTVSANSAANGGAVNVAGGELVMIDGKISGNTVTGNGGGVNLVGGKFSISGAPVISQNFKPAGDSKAANDCYVGVGQVISVGALTEGASVGLASELTTGLTSGYSDSNKFHPSIYFFSCDGQKIVATAIGQAVLRDKPENIPSYTLTYGGEEGEIDGDTVTFAYKNGAELGYRVTGGAAGSRHNLTVKDADGNKIIASPQESMKNAGTYNVEFEYGNTGYVKLMKVVVEPRVIADGEVNPAIEYTSVEYDGEEKRPAISNVQFTDGSYTFVEGVDYDVVYDKNLYPGHATATITFKVNYSGQIVLPYDITIGNGTYAATWEFYVNGAWTADCDGFTYIPGETLKSNQSGNIRAKLYQQESGAVKYAYASGVSDYKDGTVNASNLSAAKVLFAKDGATQQMLMNAGDYSITLNLEREDGLDIVVGTLAFTMARHNVDADRDKFDIRVSGENNIVYNGTAQEPTITIYFDRWRLNNETDFTVTYANNTEGGTATATIEFVGNYVGSPLTREFTIAKAVNRWSGQLNVVRWSFGQFDSEHNFFIATPTYLSGGESVHFSIEPVGGRTVGLSDIPVEAHTDAVYGACYKITDTDTIALINALGAGEYRLRATLNSTSSYDAPPAAEITIEIAQAQNSWDVNPYIRSWQYRSYSEQDNAPVATPKFGEVRITVTLGEEVFFDSANGIDNLATLGAGEYTFTAAVEGTDNYSDLSHVSSLVVSRAENRWTVSPSVAMWTVGRFDSDVNVPVARSLFGESVQLRITALDEEETVYYDSMNNINELATLGAGDYAFRALVHGTDDYTELDYTTVLTVKRAENTWKVSPSIVSWAVGGYNAEINVPVAEGTFGETVVITITDASDSTKVYYDNVSNINLLETLGAGEYSFTAFVEGTDDYTELYFPGTLTVRKAENYWKVTPSIATWVAGSYDPEVNVPVAEGTFGDAVIVICDSKDATKVYFDSANNVNNLATLGAGEYTFKVTVDGANDYTQLEHVGVLTVKRAENYWKVTPSIASWAVGGYDPAENVPVGEGFYGGAAVLTITDSKDATKVYFDSSKGINTLKDIGAGDYTFKAFVAGSNDYTQLDYTGVLTVKRAENSWTVVPGVSSWIVGEFDPETNLPVGEGRFGNVVIKITDVNDPEKVYYDSAAGINELASLTSGSYYFIASVEGSDDYTQLSYPTIFKVFDPEGLPWWAIMLIVIAALALAALIIFILWKKGVFTILTRKITLAIRTRATVDATIAAVRMSQRAEEIRKAFLEPAPEEEEPQAVEEEEASDDEEEIEETEDDVELPSSRNFDKIFNATGKDEALYKKTVLSRLIDAPDTLKARYSEFKNILLGYKKARVSMSKARESYYIGKRCYARLSIRGKTLCLYLAMAPQRFADTKYTIEDVSDVKMYADTPTLLRIRSDRAVRYGKELIEILMTEMNATPINRKQEDYVALFNAIAMLEKKRLLNYGSKKDKK